jgi:hypothetical protein
VEVYSEIFSLEMNTVIVVIVIAIIIIIIIIIVIHVIYLYVSVPHHSLMGKSNSTVPET